jgi:hypothetical protein
MTVLDGDFASALRPLAAVRAAGDGGVMPLPAPPPPPRWKPSRLAARRRGMISGLSDVEPIRIWIRLLVSQRVRVINLARRIAGYGGRSQRRMLVAARWRPHLSHHRVHALSSVRCTGRVVASSTPAGVRALISFREAPHLISSGGSSPAGSTTQSCEIPVSRRRGNSL